MGSQRRLGGLAGFSPVWRGITKVDHRAVVARESDPCSHRLHCMVRGSVDTRQVSPNHQG